MSRTQTIPKEFKLSAAQLRSLEDIRHGDMRYTGKNTIDSLLSRRLITGLGPDCRVTYLGLAVLAGVKAQRGR